MGYDIFSQPQGPVIPISLYSDAASRGINAGNAQKTTTQNIVNGLISGVQTGQEIQHNYEVNRGLAAQNEITTDPEVIQAKKDEIIARSEEEQAQNEIYQNAARTKQATEENDLNTSVLQSQIKTQQMEIQASDSKNLLQLSKLQTSDNTDEAVAALGTPEIQSTLARYPQWGQQYVTTLKQRGVPEDVLAQYEKQYTDLAYQQRANSAKGKFQDLAGKALEKEQLSAGQFEAYKNSTPEFDKFTKAGNFDARLLDIRPSKQLNSQKTPVGYDYVYGNQVIKENAIIKDQYKDASTQLQAWKKTHVHLTGGIPDTLKSTDTAAATEQPATAAEPVKSAALVVDSTLPPVIASDKFLQAAVKGIGFAPSIVEQAAPSFKKLNSELRKFENVSDLTSPTTKQLLSNTVNSAAREISDTIYKSTPSIKSRFTMADVEAYNKGIYSRIGAGVDPIKDTASIKTDQKLKDRIKAQLYSKASNILPDSMAPESDFINAFKVNSPEELYFVTQGTPLVQQLNSLATTTLTLRKQARDLLNNKNNSSVDQTNILQRMSNGG